jgi:hypothetical protein
MTDEVNLWASRWRLPTGWIGTIRSRRCCRRRTGADAGAGDVYAIACDIHPINNMRVLRYLSDELKVSEEEKKRWYAHWIQQGSARWSSCCATRNPAILRGRCADAGGLLSGAAVGQRAADGLRSEPLSALPGGL